jgi:hypothetical protein
MRLISLRLFSTFSDTNKWAKITRVINIRFNSRTLRFFLMHATIIRER